jgi:5-methylcytosine-specific restriction endonuclease McrA
MTDRSEGSGIDWGAYWAANPPRPPQPRQCLTDRCRNDAVPGRSRCREHGSGWDRKPKSRDLAYIDARYKANREIVLAQEPTCHWRFEGCTGKSTQADHLIAVSRGGSNDLSNLVGSCESCNRLRGIDLGNQTKRGR